MNERTEPTDRRTLLFVLECSRRRKNRIEKRTSCLVFKSRKEIHLNLKKRSKSLVDLGCLSLRQRETFSVDSVATKLNRSMFFRRTWFRLPSKFFFLVVVVYLSNVFLSSLWSIDTVELSFESNFVARQINIDPVILHRQELEKNEFLSIERRSKDELDEFIIENEELCLVEGAASVDDNDRLVDLIIVVKSKAEDRKRRDSIRSTWINRTNDRSLSVVLAFLIGALKPVDRSTRRASFNVFSFRQIGRQQFSPTGICRARRSDST